MKRTLISIFSWVVAFNLLMILRYFDQDFASEIVRFSIIGATVSGVVVGAIFSTAEIFFSRANIKRKSFVYSFLLRCIVFIVAIGLTILTTVLVIEFLSPDFTVSKYVDSLQKVITSSTTSLYILFAAILTALFYYNKQIYKKVGPGVLTNLLIGKYHKPREEERIFMFLDMASSTAIAEKLDSFTFSSFLQDFFSDLDELIQKTRGMTFQFVGDEVVIVWKLKDGIRNNNCVKFFFMAQKKMQLEKHKYLDKYGVIPEFKAGMHYGKIVIAKVGESKEEMAYHGDTINTAARIRSECNNSDKKILISAELLSILSELDDGYKIESKGVFSLKGKKNVVGLVSIEETE